MKLSAESTVEYIVMLIYKIVLPSNTIVKLFKNLLTNSIQASFNYYIHRNLFPARSDFLANVLFLISLVMGHSCSKAFFFKNASSKLHFQNGWSYIIQAPFLCFEMSTNVNNGNARALAVRGAVIVKVYERWGSYCTDLSFFICRGHCFV